MDTKESAHNHRRIIMVGMLALATATATAMGIGRFAFTPLLPMMLHDRVISLSDASWLASAIQWVAKPENSAMRLTIGRTQHACHLS
jgi:predicted MFS family arabinose efflux permease